MRTVQLIAWYTWKALLAIFIVTLCLVAVFDVQGLVGRGLLAFFVLCLLLVMICTTPDV